MTLSSIVLVVCFELFSSEEPVAGGSAAATAETESDQDGCSHDGPHHCKLSSYNQLHLVSCLDLLAKKLNSHWSSQLSHLLQVSHSHSPTTAR